MNTRPAQPSRHAHQAAAYRGPSLATSQHPSTPRARLRAPGAILGAKAPTYSPCRRYLPDGKPNPNYNPSIRKPHPSPPPPPKRRERSENGAENHSTQPLILQGLLATAPSTKTALFARKPLIPGSFAHFRAPGQAPGGRTTGKVGLTPKPALLN